MRCRFGLKVLVMLNLGVALMAPSGCQEVGGSTGAILSQPADTSEIFGEFFRSFLAAWLL
jgi:hypothetical protein